MYRTTDREPEAARHVEGGKFDSVLGDRECAVGTYKEFVVYDADQLYTEYVVLYERLGAFYQRIPPRIAAGAALEVPPYDIILYIL